LLLQLKSY